MAHSPDKSGVPTRGHQPSTLSRIWTFIVSGLAAFGTLSILVLMVIICADIVARNVMGSSLPLVSETGALMVVLIVALQLGATVHANRMARTEVISILLNQKSPRAAALLEVIFNLAGMAIVGAIAWASVDVLVGDYTSREFIGTPGLGTLPTWPFRALIMLGMSVAAIEFLVRAISSLRAAFGGSPAHESG